MRTLHSFATICVFSAALAALLSACSSTDSGTPAPATGAGDATRGAALWVKQPDLACDGCHGPHGEGSSAPNITKSVTGGIGAFTYTQFHMAVREGKNKEGQALCVAMSPFDPKYASEQDIADLYAFQQSLPPVDAPAANPTFCGNKCCTGEHK